MVKQASMTVANGRKNNDSKTTKTCEDVWIWGGPEAKDSVSVPANLILDKNQYKEFLTVVCRGNERIAQEIFSSYLSHLLEQHTGGRWKIHNPHTMSDLLEAVAKYYQEQGRAD